MKIAFSGTGYINKIHARAALACGVELAAVVNHRRESMEQFAAEFGIARQYDSVQELLADGDVDGLVVSTPNYLHLPDTVASLEAGIHVMVEKPMAQDAGEARRMCAAAEKSGSLLMVAHCFRFDPEVRWLKENAARLGRIIRTKGYGVHANWGPGGWFTQKRFAGGGAMADMGVHAIDTARFLLGDPRPVSVYAHIGTYYGDYDVDDTGVFLVEWDNGVNSYFESGWWQPHVDAPQAATQLYGINGFGSVFPTRLELADRGTSKVEVVDSGYEYPRDEQVPQSMYEEQMRHFLECIEKNEKPKPGGEVGLVNMQVVEAAYESARSGQAVKIPAIEEANS